MFQDAPSTRLPEWGGMQHTCYNCAMGFKTLILRGEMQHTCYNGALGFKTLILREKKLIHAIYEFHEANTKPNAYYKYM